MLKVTLYANRYSYSGVDTKYIFKLEGEQITEGKKEYIANNSKEIQKGDIDEMDLYIIKDELKNLLILEKIKKAVRENKKSITVSSFVNASKQYKEYKEKNSKRLDNELEKIKKEIIKDAEYNGASLEYYKNLYNKIKNNNYIKENLTSEEMTILKEKLAIAQQVRKEFDYKYENLISIEQNEDTTIYEFAHHYGINRYFYLVTNRKNHTKRVNELMIKILKLEGYEIDIDRDVKQINYRTCKYDRDALEITRDQLQEIKKLGDAVCKRKYPYVAVYKEDEGKLKKVV